MSHRAGLQEYTTCHGKSVLDRAPTHAPLTGEGVSQAVPGVLRFAFLIGDPPTAQNALSYTVLLDANVCIARNQWLNSA